MAESEQGSIRTAWPATCQELETCVACDFKYFCDRCLADATVAGAENLGGDDDQI
jgi:hypothetical protein